MERHIGPLTGLRGVAAYSVLVAHAAHSSFPYYDDLIYQRLSAFGMSLFFVLSGFVIYYNYADLFRQEPLPRAGWRFFVARFARLYPLYAVSILIALPRIPSIFDEQPWVFVSYLTLTQSWFNTLIAVFPPAWSISTEWFFYLAFVPLLVLVNRIPPTVTMIIVYCALAAVGLWGLLSSGWLEPLVRDHLFFARNVSAEPHAWLTYFGAPTRLLEFMAGLLAAKIYRAGRGIGGTYLWVAAAWCVAVVVVGPLTDAGWLKVLLPNFIFAPALALFLVGVCAAPNVWFGRALASRAAMFMGDISYSVYVWSFFVLDALRDKFRLQAWSEVALFNSVLRVVIAVGLTTIFAYGSFVLLEQPARRWIRATFEPRKSRSNVKQQP